MAKRSVLVALCVIYTLLIQCVMAAMYSSRLFHRFSDEVKAVRVFTRTQKGVVDDSVVWPEKKSLDYYRMLSSSDLQRRKILMKLGGSQYQFLFPSEGSKTMSLGNDFGWLHYTWIDIGTPNVSFLVALDAGSDLLWIPCDCVQCAPLSASYYSSLLSPWSIYIFGAPWYLGASIMQDRDLNEYNPSESSTSKLLSCSHPLCELGPHCKSPNETCPYTVNYFSEDTKTSGLLVEDILHLASGSSDTFNHSVGAQVIIGCGSKQSGGYLDGIAPDGLMGLGLGEISVPSFLAKVGLIKNSFSLCFDEDGSGRIFFGDQGLATQQTTPFLPSDGIYVTYIVGMDACCVGSSCLEQTSFKAIVDSGSSFTYIPDDVYESVVQEFDRRVNATKSSFEGYPWQYCYKSSSRELPIIPSLTLKFASNNSFVVHNPVFVIYGTEGVVGFCLAIQPADGEIGTIGQNFMAGYRMIFDRENLKLGWLLSNCQDISDGERLPLTPSLNGSSPNSLPTIGQQTPNGPAVAPAIAGRTHSRSSAVSIQEIMTTSCLVKFLPPLLLMLLTTFRTF